MTSACSFPYQSNHLGIRVRDCNGKPGAAVYRHACHKNREPNMNATAARTWNEKPDPKGHAPTYSALSTLAGFAPAARRV